MDLSNLDFARITACGECCDGCKKKDASLCEGCIESDGHCKEWAQSGQCPVHKCAKEHKVQFCGLCAEFPCEGLASKIHWNPNIIAHLTYLSDVYHDKHKNNSIQEDCIMPAKIIKIQKETYPASRFIGKKYTDSDRVDGSFGAKWSEWMANDMFTPLEALNPLPQSGGAYFGVMRINNGVFEYWIGMFFPADAETPEGYECVDVEALDYAVFWIYGNEQSGELYGLDNHNMCLSEIDKQSWVRKEDDWCFERYNCPRFTTPDEHGNVILDYGIAIER